MVSSREANVSFGGRRRHTAQAVGGSAPTRSTGQRGHWATQPLDDQAKGPVGQSTTWDRCGSIRNVIATFLRSIAAAPRHDGYGRGRILRRAFDNPVRVNHVNQDVPLGVAAPYDLHLLEE